MNFEITLIRINKQSLTISFSVLTCLVLATAAYFAFGFSDFSFSSGSGSEANFKGYKPFVPQGPFAAAIKLLPSDKDLATEKLEQLKAGLSPAIDARRLYILAQINQRARKLPEALAQYSKVNLSALPYLADRVLIHKAEIAAELGDEKMVIESCKKVLQFYGHSLSLPAAHYELARSYLRQSKTDQAQAEFTKVKDEFPDSQQAIGSLFYLGQTSGSKAQRNSLWQEYLSQSPDGRFANEIITVWSDELSTLTPKQKSLMGLSYFVQGKKTEAANFLAAEINEKTWYPLAQLQLENKQKVLALKTLTEGLKRFPQSEDFYNGIASFIRSSGAAEREALFTTLISSAKPDKVPYLLWKQSTISSGAKRKELLQQIEKQYPSSLWAGRASSEIFWEAYKDGQYQVAKNIGEQFLKNYSNAAEAPKVRFWLAKRAEAEGDRVRARSLYNEILELNSTNYYAFRANGRLVALNGGKDPGWTLFNEPRLTMLAGLNDNSEWIWPLPQDELKRLHPTLQELFALNLWQEALVLMPANYDKEYPALYAWLLARVEDKVNEAIRIAADEISKKKARFNTNHDYWFISYPFLFSQHAYKSGVQHGFDPLLILALIRQESRFQHKVVSSAKAIGLCQLMPGTAKEVAKSIGYPIPNFNDLCRPELNIELGAKYLSGLITQFNGQAQLAVAAYNAGPGSVSKWLKTSGNTDPDFFVETIPFQETQKYVINVFENYWVYSNLIKQNEVANNKLAESASKEQNLTEGNIDYPSTTTAQ
jgi:soluble lytic murein transglycosylase